MIVSGSYRPRQLDRFAWLPVADRRHAIWSEFAEVSVGSDVVTLCGKRLIKVAAGTVEWLWPTCWTCWDHAKVVRRS